MILPTYLCKAFTQADPKSAKRQSCHQSLPALFGSACIKAARKMFVKLTTDSRPRCSTIHIRRAVTMCHRDHVSFFILQIQAFSWINKPRTENYCQKGPKMWHCTLVDPVSLLLFGDTSVLFHWPSMTYFLIGDYRKKLFFNVGGIDNNRTCKREKEVWETSSLK